MIVKFTSDNEFDKFVLSEPTMTLIEESDSAYQNSALFRHLIDDGGVDINPELDDYENDNILDFFHILYQQNRIERKTGIVSVSTLLDYHKYFQDHLRFRYLDGDLLRHYLINCGFIDEATPKRTDSYSLTKKTLAAIKSADKSQIPLTFTTTIKLVGSQKTQQASLNGSNSEETSIYEADDDVNYVKDFLFYLFLEKKIPPNCRIVKKSLLTDELRQLKAVELREMIDFETPYLILMPHENHDTLLMTSRLIDEFQTYEEVFYQSQFYRFITVGKSKKSPKKMSRKEVETMKRDNVLLFLLYLKGRHLINESKPKQTVNKCLAINELIKLQNDNYFNNIDLERAELRKIMLENDWIENPSDPSDFNSFVFTNKMVEEMDHIDLTSHDNLQQRLLVENQHKSDHTVYSRDNILIFLAHLQKRTSFYNICIKKTMVFQELATVQAGFRFTYIIPEYFNAYLYNAGIATIVNSDDFEIDSECLKAVDLFTIEHPEIPLASSDESSVCGDHLTALATFWPMFFRYLQEKGSMKSIGENDDERQTIPKIQFINEIIEFHQWNIFLNVHLQNVSY